MCFSIPAARGSAPFTSRVSWEPQEGKPGLYWRKPHFQHLPKVSAGVCCFLHTPSSEAPLIPARFAKLCLAEPSSLRLRSLMGTVWTESQHSPRSRGGAEVTMCATLGVTASLPSPVRGKALQSLAVEEAAAGKARYSPDRCQGSWCSLPEIDSAFKHMLDARWSPEKASPGGVFVLKPMDL